MSGSSLSSAGLDPRRRRILFRAKRRGVREMDIALGRFADAYLAALSEADLSEFERWLELPDPEILAWVTGEAPIPHAFDTPLFARLRAAPLIGVNPKRKPS
jgi:antitoxin CptB